MGLTQTEENYIKEIFKLSEKTEGCIATNAIADAKETTAASVTDMVKKLAQKGYVQYIRYKGSQLTESGNEVAKALIRKHRLWEVFLVKQLNFNWDEVHEIAEQLEHIQSEALTERLDAYLDFPKLDPHGDPIPDAKGNITYTPAISLTELHAGQMAVIVGVNDHSNPFLHYLDKLEIALGVRVQVLEIYSFDSSRHIMINDTKEVVISKQIAQNLQVKPSN